MKRLKITSIVLSVAMIMSMIIPPVAVIADETSAPSETQKTEAVDNKEPESKEKPSQKATEKPDVKETEKQKPAETEKEDPKESDPQKPEETENEEPKETEKKEPEETEPLKPSEPDQQVPEETEKPEPKETESQEPKENEKQEPSETETPVPSETEKQEPAITESPEKPETDKKTPKGALGTISNAKISDGILTWDEYAGAVCYEIFIEDMSDFADGMSVNLNRTIDRLIKDGNITKSSSYAIKLVAYDDEFESIAQWTTSYSYTSSANPIEEGEITGVKIENGVLTWNSYQDAKSYKLWIAGSPIDTLYVCSLNLYDKIDQMIRAGEIEKAATYEIEITALDDDDATLARVFETCTYNSSANPEEEDKIKNIKCVNGILTWDAVDGAKDYTIDLDGWGWNSTSTTFDLGKEIDELIKNRYIEKSSTYEISVTAYSSDGTWLAESKVQISYESSVNPIEIGTIANAKVTDGLLTWDSYEGTDYYIVYVGDEVGDSSKEAKLNLNSLIDTNIANGELEKNSPYTVKITALNSDSVVIAEYRFNYSYDSSANPPQWGAITNVAINNGIVTFDAFSDADYYGLKIERMETYFSGTNFNLDECIDDWVGDNRIEKRDIYTITLFAFNTNDQKIARWIGTYNASGSPQIVASGECGENLTWSLKNDGVLTISGSGNMSKWYDILSAPWYRYRLQISQVVFDGNITSFGEGAFLGCTGLESFDIPQGITALPTYVFSGCSNLKNISLPDGVKSIGDYAFSSCSSLKSISLNAGLESIGDNAFSSCTSLTSITLPDGLKTIGNSAFYNCAALPDLPSIPDSVTSVGEKVFVACCKESKHITIPKGITKIDENSFYNYPKLESVTISEGVTSIDNRAFIFCSNLKRVSLPESMVSIGEKAFYNCGSLESINLPNSISLIGDEAFHGCKALTSVNIPSSLDSIGKDVFCACGFTSVSIPRGVTVIGESAFSVCQNLQVVNIPNSVTDIGNGAFSGCKALKNADVPNSVKTIGEWAFYGCDSFTSVVIPDSVTSIGVCAFANCANLKNVILPDKNISLAGNVFTNNSSIEAIVLNKSAYDKELFEGYSDYNFHFYYDVVFSGDSHGTVNGNKRSFGTDVYSFIVTPENGYCIESVVLINGETTVELTSKVVDGSDIIYSYTMPDSDDGVVIKVSYKLIGHNRITVAQTVNGTASVEQETAKSGDTVVITTTPETGYEVDTIKINGKPNEGSTFVMPDENVTVEVTFKKSVYSITVTENANGKIYLNKYSAYYGDVITITATPNTGYKLELVTVNGKVSSPSSLVMPAENVMITASFKKILYSVSLEPTVNGTVEVDSTTGTYGDLITIIASPDEGYELDTIKINGKINKGNTFNMPAENVDVTVEFKPVVGHTEQVDNGDYQITNNNTDGTGTATFTGVEDATATKVVVPATVEIKGKSYKVNRIATNAFRGNTTVNTVVLGANVTSIDPYAFKGCSNLVSVSGLSHVKTIGTRAFANCPKLKTFTITSSSLSKIGAYAFYGNKNLKTLNLKYTTKLTKSGVKKSLKGSKIKTVKVKKSKLKKYKKFFTKKNCGRKVKVKK